MDFLSPEPGEEFLAESLAAPHGSVIDAPPLIYLKLKASRMQDRADVVALIKAGLDLDPCREYLSAHAPTLLARFENLVAVAQAEQD